jgi:glutamine cyclotransferase
MRRGSLKLRAFLWTSLFVVVPSAQGCGEQPTANGRSGEVAVVVRTFPHDTTAYTQGLVFRDGALYEGTGQTGRSTLRRVELETGQVVQKADLPSSVFGEGIAIVGDRIFQLTWTSGVAYAFDRATLALQDSFTYQGQGWGLTYDGESLIMSDGTSRLRFLDPETFEVRRQVEVTDNGAPLRDINELEWVDGQILANVYQTDEIVRIDPASGNILGWIDASGVYPRSQRPTYTDVLNGIAWDPDTRRLFVTGKLWPVLFEVEIRPAS